MPLQNRVTPTGDIIAAPHRGLFTGNRGIIHDPEVVFLDEPTIGVDPVGARELRALMANLIATGKTVLLTTHYMFEADELCDRIAVIAKGEIVGEGTPTELKAEIGRPTVEAVPCDPGERERTAAVLARFGEPGDAGTKGAAVLLAGGGTELAEVVRTLDAEGIAIETLQLHAPSLDDVFLAKTGRSLEGAEEVTEEADDARAETAEAA